MKKCFWLAGVILFVSLLASALQAAEISFPGTKSVWNGFTMYKFEIDCGKFGKRPAQVVCPKEAKAGNPWLWRAVFFGHEPQVEKAMLEQGFYVAYLSCTDLLGSPEQIAQRNCLYDFLVKEKGFNPKPCLLGMSRGGISCMNWAIANPDKVGPIYIDNPVLDFKTWPCGFLGGLKRSQGDWASLMKSYGFKSDDEAKAYKKNPIDAYQPLIDHKVPVLLMCGTADAVVPYDLNGKILWERMKNNGGIVTHVRKPGHDHHPHSLKDPKIIVDFYLNPPQKCSESETTYLGK